MIKTEQVTIIRGTWDELVAYKDEFPTDALLEVRLSTREENHNVSKAMDGHKSVAARYSDLIGVLDFEPTDMGRRAEEYLDGFGESKANATKTS